MHLQRTGGQEFPHHHRRLGPPAGTFQARLAFAGISVVAIKFLLN